ncbi:rRNA methyltransferase 1, mitochondrial-like [Phoenix dactylifera]|uniref:rRNA methyltransferase 1, mitochondrial n=1 Tax=Phoenix dactylifera TaxID=42345 RepID=A0A8B8JCY4_PHODC|nr:rRNA methyltransferase 1, mitochondrial-like [Phoenix dactylifera]
MYHCSLIKIPAIPLFSRPPRRLKCWESARSFNSRSFADSFLLEALENSTRRNSQTLGGGRGGSSRCLREGFLQKAWESTRGKKARGFSRGFHLPPLEIIGCARTRIFPSGFCLKTLESRSFSDGLHLRSLERIHGIQTRVFSSDPEERAVDNVDSKSLPWLAADGDKERKVVEKRASLRSNNSSWEQSAEIYFSRNSGMLMKGNSEGRDRSEESIKSSRGFANEEKYEDVKEEDNEPIGDPRWDRIKNVYKGFVDRESRFEKPEVRRWNKQEKWGRKTWKEATESSVPKMVGQGVYGVAPVLAALTAAGREFYALYVQEGLDLSKNNKKKKDKKAVEKVLQIAEKIGLKVIVASKHDLNMMVDNRPHQGLVLDASPLEMVSIRELEPVSVEGQKAPLWVALDEVTDPQNLGAIIRSAYFFGAEGVVLCAKNSAPLSGVVSKASAGSLELIELLSCKNMMQFLSSSIENGWRVLGGSVSSRAIPLNEVEAGVPTILVLGSEGSGLRALVERTCTELIKIPGFMPGWVGTTEMDAQEKVQINSGQDLKSFHAVESLNVSVAAGVFLYHLIGHNSHVVD